MNVNAFDVPRLKPEGAGLPLVERLLLRHVLMPLRLRTTTWQAAQEQFHRETETVLDIYKNRIPPEYCGQKFLIKRLMGLEDSSRYWSPTMVLDHMALVARGMTSVITTLAREQYLIFDVQIAAFKPKEDTTGCYADTFAKMMRDCEESLSTITHHHSKTRHAHPWFGMLNANEWHTLLATHHAIHRRQLQEIIKLLPANR
jgi:hypothetical protein